MGPAMVLCILSRSLQPPLGRWVRICLVRQNRQDCAGSLFWNGLVGAISSSFVHWYPGRQTDGGGVKNKAQLSQNAHIKSPKAFNS